MNILTYIRKSLPSLLFMVSVSLWAQQEASAVVSSPAPANASTAYTKSWSAFYNPAVLSEVKKNTVSLGYQNRFQMKELSSMQAAGSIVTKPVDIGVAVSRFGYSQYNEIQAGAAASRKFSKYFYMGVGLNYYSVYFSADEGSKGTVIADVGLLSEVLENFFIGFHATNVAQTSISIGNTEKRIPSVFSLGAEYKFGESVRMLGQLDKEVDNDIIWRAGFEYQVIKELSLRLGGYGSGSFVPSFGATVDIKNIKLDVDFEHHPSLGFNSIIGLGYTF